MRRWTRVLRRKCTRHAYQVLTLGNQLKLPLAPCAPTICEGWALMQREHWAGADFHRDPPSPFTSYTLATGLVETAAEWSIPRFPWEPPHANARLLPLAFVTTMRRNVMDLMYFGRILRAGEHWSHIIALFSFTKILMPKLGQRCYLVFWSWLACSVVAKLCWPWYFHWRTFRAKCQGTPRRAFPYTQNPNVNSSNSSDCNQMPILAMWPE